MIEMIMAAGLNGEIGKDNKLLWRLKDDMKHFVNVTKGKNVVMGRKTCESLPNGVLYGRKNYVLSNTISLGYYVNHNTYIEYLTYEQFLKKDIDCVVIGGSQVYELFKDKADIVHLTVVDATFPEADAFAPLIDFTDGYKFRQPTEYLANENNEYPFAIYKLTRC